MSTRHDWGGSEMMLAAAVSGFARIWGPVVMLRSVATSAAKHNAPNCHHFGYEVLIALALVVAALPAIADEVTLRSSEGATNFVAQGRVVDWTREQIVIERSTGQPARYAADRVVNVATNWPAEYRTGQHQLAAGLYRQAATNLLTAARAEQRPWARRQVMAELARCSASAGNWAAAGDTWLAAVAGEPAARAIDEPPLAWFAVPTVDGTALERWQAAREVYPQLLAASFLLQTRDRATGTQRLEQLAKNSDERVARLATAQLWRTKFQASADEVDRWQTQAEQWGDDVGGGPWLAIADARAALDDHEAAILAALRPALQAPTGSPLVARGLLIAARSAAKSGHPADARRLANEVVRQHSESPQRVEAKALLDSLLE